TKLGLTGIHDDTAEFDVENRKTGKLEHIEPAVPFFPELLPDQGTRRERLARWTTHPKNLYFARAIVNRVWALLFGKPLVNPADDLSTGGDPRALTLLAMDFADHRYDLQRLIKIIAATDVFQRDSAADHEITAIHVTHWAVFPLTRLRPEQV